MSFEDGQREVDLAPNEKKKSNFDRLSKLLRKKKTEKAEGKEPEKKQQQSIRNFVMGDELGIGNFSKIMVATQKDNNVKYALKMIEKAEVDRMKKRHPNIHNEIAMEKRVLAKLNGFPGVVTMFSTFQDYYCLYYQMEYLTCGELWSKISDTQGYLVGTYASLATRWIAEMVLAIEVCIYIYICVLAQCIILLLSHILSCSSYVYCLFCSILIDSNLKHKHVFIFKKKIIVG
jgi:serine/threonine protein kinase